MDISAFLTRHRLTKVWLYEQIRACGFDISESFLSRIISGERDSDLARKVRAACERICKRYEDGMRDSRNEEEKSK